jgi:uncharacterized membrane protein
MESKVAVNRHPIHPMLVPLPIGLMVWTFVADIIYLTNGDSLWYGIAFWSGVAGVVTALLAALAGLGDYLGVAVHTKARGMATTHMLLNIVTVALFIAAALIMRDDNAMTGANRNTVVILHGIGVALLAVSGWLGGELSFRHHLGMVPHDAQAERERHLLTDAHEGVTNGRNKEHEERIAREYGARERRETP